SHSSSITYTYAHSGSIMEDVLHSFVVENEPTKQLAYEDFEQVDQIEMEELDIKWQMTMLSLRINRFQKKAGRNINFNKKDPARFNRRKARCYNCLQSGHFARECNVKKVDEKARYYAFKISEEKTKEPKAMSDFTDHVDNAAGSVSDAAAEFAMMGISSKAKIEKKEWEVKLVESLARFDKWKESSKNLVKLINSSMSSRTKLGLGFKETIGSDDVFDLSTPSVFDPEPENREVKSIYERFVKAGEMRKVPPPITGTFMPTSYKSDLEETQETFGSKSNTSSINTFESNDFVSCDNSDKSSESETSDFASCVSRPKTNDSSSTIDVKILPKSDVKDPSPTNGNPSCSFTKNVKPPRNLCNKSGIADRIHCKNNFVRTKTCFVYGSKTHLIKDCDVYDNVPSIVSKAASVPAGSRNSSAFISVGRSIPAASRNRPTSIHAGRHIPAGRFNKPTPFPAGRSVPTGARPFFRPTNLYFDNVYWPRIYDHMSMNEGTWGSAVKSSAGTRIEGRNKPKGRITVVTQNWMVFTFHVPFWNEKWLVQGGTTLELASPEQTATGKDVSNPFMAVMVCQKPLGYFRSPMIHVPRAGLMLLFYDPAVFDVPADCSCWFPHFCWFLVAAVWLFAAVLFRSCCWNKVTILELASEDLSRILKLTLSNSRLGEDCWELQIRLDLTEAMYDDYIGGQPSATGRTVPHAQEPQVRQSSTASTTIADTAPTPTNSSSHATNIPITSQDVDELNSNAMFKRLDVWVLVPAPDNILPLTLRWLFKNKHDEEQKVIRNKSRLVVRGYRQEEGIDFKESFTPNHFFNGTIDPTLFIRRFHDNILVVQVYVDDIIFGFTHP
nr:hypothetical protein [Tanacetum cinerariifolium]